MTDLLENLDQSLYKTILDALHDGVYFVNRERRVLYWNKGAERLSGFSASEVLGKKCAEGILNHVNAKGTCLCLKGCPLAGCMRDGKAREVNAFMHHKAGHRIPVSIHSFPIRDNLGKISGSVEVFKDMSLHLSMISEFESLRQDALIDPLSGVGNRRFADLSRERLCAAQKKENRAFGVIFVDIDNFKTINDTWGHAFGDRVIVTIAKTLSATLRPNDIVCRMGGDEFIVFLPNATSERLEIVGKRLKHLIKESWIDLGEETVTFSASLGAAHSGDLEDVCSVVEKADKQLYLSKNNGRDCLHLDGQRF